MKKVLFTLVFALVAVCGFVSCDKDDNYPKTDQSSGPILVPSLQNLCGEWFHVEIDKERINFGLDSIKYTETLCIYDDGEFTKKTIDPSIHVAGNNTDDDSKYVIESGWWKLIGTVIQLETFKYNWVDSSGNEWSSLATTDINKGEIYSYRVEKLTKRQMILSYFKGDEIKFKEYTR